MSLADPLQDAIADLEELRPVAAASARAWTLDQLPVGASAILGAPEQLGSTVLRLLEMGLTPGTQVLITRRAPRGGPIELRVRGTRLCVRRADVARFPVSPLGAVAPGARDV